MWNFRSKAAHEPARELERKKVLSGNASLNLSWLCKSLNHTTGGIGIIANRGTLIFGHRLKILFGKKAFLFFSLFPLPAHSSVPALTSSSAWGIAIGDGRSLDSSDPRRPPQPCVRLVPECRWEFLWSFLGLFSSFHSPFLSSEKWEAIQLSLSPYGCCFFNLGRIFFYGIDWGISGFLVIARTRDWASAWSGSE